MPNHSAKSFLYKTLLVLVTPSPECLNRKIVIKVNNNPIFGSAAQILADAYFESYDKTHHVSWNIDSYHGKDTLQWRHMSSPITDHSNVYHWNEKIVMVAEFGAQVKPVTTWVVTTYTCSHQDYQGSHNDYLENHKDYVG